MDFLYSRYSNPWELIKMYIEQGQFGEFVTNIIGKHKEQAEKEEEQKLWSMYIHSMSDKSFIDWKSAVLSQNNVNVALASSGGDENMTDDDIVNIINNLFQ